MKRLQAEKSRWFVVTALMLIMVCLFSGRSLAAPTDIIHLFEITVDVNEDASLNMAYHIEWEVLDDSIGKLEWVDLGVPNSHHDQITPLSETVDHIEDKGSSLHIYLDRGYSEGETVDFDFSMTQDHMYQIDKWVEGETVYTFTPAWFDGMETERLIVRWNAQDAGAWQPDCLQDGGYLVFDTSLGEGEKFTMSVTYPNDAFGFVPERQAGSGSTSGSGEEMSIADAIIYLFCAALMIFVIAAPFVVAFKGLSRLLSGGSGFGSSQKTQKKIKRTKIEYYENCPNCGAAREEGKDSCSYCHRSMIKSREVVEESEIKEPEKYAKAGTYRYGDAPNTFIRVNVINVPVRSSHSSRSSHRSSCASSCACVSSCACASTCACACACASSGRAGCSVKDFFKKSIHEGRIRVRKL